MIARRILVALTCRIGKDRGISVKGLAFCNGICERHVRRYISQLRGEGYAICGTPETGYYMAQTAEELEQTCQFLRSRAMHSLVLESKLRKIPLPDLLGQLHLKT
mgnify:FL=1